MGRRILSHCPWLIEDSDVNHAESTLLSRDSRIDGTTTRQVAMTVTGQYDPSLIVGVVAVRCERVGGEWVPSMMCLTDYALEGVEPQRGMDVGLLSQDPEAAV